MKEDTIMATIKKDSYARIKVETSKIKRNFTPFIEDINQLLNAIMDKGLITLVKEKIFPNNIPNDCKLEYFGNYHSGPNHPTKNCSTLRNKIQGLHDKEKFLFNHEVKDNSIHPQN